MSILSQILRIFVENVVIFLATTLLVFALIRWIPGDAVTEKLGPGASEEQKAELRHTLGLDRPFLVQYASRLHSLASLELGLLGGHSITDKVIHGTLITLQLTIGAAVLLVLLGVPIGVISGLHPRSVTLNALNYVIYVVSMVPVFLLGYASFIPYRPHKIVPIIVDIPDMVQRGHTNLSEFQLYVLIYLTMIGVMAIGDGTITELVRAVREETGRILESDFIRAVRANGGAVWKHLAKNLIVPVATVVNLRILYLLGGSVVVEWVYEYPALGSLTMEAVSAREYNLIFTLASISVLIVLAVTTFNRILITLVDPRTRD